MIYIILLTWLCKDYSSDILTNVNPLYFKTVCLSLLTSNHKGYHNINHIAKLYLLCLARRVGVGVIIPGVVTNRQCTSWTGFVSNAMTNSMQQR